MSPRSLLAALLLLLSASPAWSAEAEVWAAMHNGRLASAFDRDPLQSIAIYEAVLEHLPRRDPQRGELLLALGRAHMDAGNPEAARAVLTEAATLPTARDEAATLLKLLDVWESRVTELPYRSTPSATLARGESWRLYFAELPVAIDEITILVLAEGEPTVLRIELESLDGRRLPSLDAVEVPADTWLDLPLDMSDLRAVLSSTPGTVGGDRRLWMLTLQALEGASSQDAVLQIAEVEVR